jgi:hypothetical protein
VCAICSEVFESVTQLSVFFSLCSASSTCFVGGPAGTSCATILRDDPACDVVIADDFTHAGDGDKAGFVCGNNQTEFVIAAEFTKPFKKWHRSLHTTHIEWTASRRKPTSYCSQPHQQTTDTSGVVLRIIQPAISVKV